MVHLEEITQSQLWTQVQRILNIHLMALSKEPKMNSERMKQTLSSLQELVKTMLPETGCRESFYGSAFRPALGHLFSCLLDVFSDANRDLQLRLNASELLERITDPQYAQETGDALAFVLPGVFARCQQTAVDSAYSTSAQVTCAALQIISRLIRSTMNNEAHERCMADTEGDAKKEGTSLRQGAADRNLQWFEMASKRISQALTSLAAKLCTVKSDRIRSALLECVSSVDASCSKAFGEELQVVVVDLCIVYLSDEAPGVQIKANGVLEAYRRDQRDFLLKHVGEKLYRTCTALPVAVQNASSGAEPFQNLINVLRAMDSESMNRAVQASSSIVERLVGAISAVIRVDKKRLMISQNTAAQRGVLDAFRLAHSIRMKQVVELADAVADLGISETVFATVLDNLRSAAIERQVAYAIFLAALLHFLREKDFSDGTMLSCVKSCLAECTELLEGLDGIEPDVKDEAVENVSQSHSDETCLAMALLLSTGLSAALLKSDPRFSKHLVNALYDLLKWCGTTTFVVRESAENALELIARSTSASVPSMLSAHAPLITYKVSLACKDYRRNPRAPVVLSELLNRCEASTVFAQVQHIVPELLMALDRNDQKKTTLILRALRSFVRAMRRWFPELKPAPVDDTFPGCSTAVDDDDAEPEEEEESAVMEEKKTPPPAQIRTVVDVLNRTKHMISSPHLPVQLLVLDILDASLRFVRHFENELLPMIHQNWLGLVHKFGAGWSLDLSDQRKLVAARAVKVAETMAELSGSFIYHKVAKEFTPKVTEFLRRSMQSSEGTGKVYTHTATYKYQLAILRSIPTFVEKCGLTEKDRAPLLEALEAYAASPKQAPSLLQQATESLEQCRRFSQ